MYFESGTYISNIANNENKKKTFFVCEKIEAMGYSIKR